MTSADEARPFTELGMFGYQEVRVTSYKILDVRCSQLWITRVMIVNPFTTVKQYNEDDCIYVTDIIGHPVSIRHIAVDYQYWNDGINDNLY